MTSEEGTAIGSRLDVIERDYQHLAHDVDVRLAALERKLDRITEAVSRRGRVRWELVISVVIAVATLIGGAWVGVNQRFVPVENDILETRARLERHERTDSHPKALEKNARQDAMIETNQEMIVLVREMIQELREAGRSGT